MPKVVKVIILAELDDKSVRQVPLTEAQTNSVLEHIAILQGGNLRVAVEESRISIKPFKYIKILEEKSETTTSTKTSKSPKKQKKK